MPVKPRSISALAILALLLLQAATSVGGATAYAPQSVPAARFFGTVRDASGQPLRGATVTAIVGGVQCGSGSSDQAGKLLRRCPVG